MLDGNFKSNLFYKRDNGTDKALTDGRMYFPPQKDFEDFANSYVVKAEDKVISLLKTCSLTDAEQEVPCKNHIGSIHNQSKMKYKNTRFSGVVASVCSHGLPGGFVDMLISEACVFSVFSLAGFKTNIPLC